MIFKSRHALPFHHASTLFLVWITLVMSFIAVLTLSASLSLINIISFWNTSVTGSLTIQVPTFDLKGDNRIEAAQQDISNIVSFLSEYDGISDVHILSDEEIAVLMEPWLGVLEQMQELPIPKLLDVKIEKSAAFDFNEFQNSLNQIAPFAKADSHRILLANLIETASGVQKVVWFILLLLVLTTMGTVTYTTNANLTAQKETLRLLHLMGARNFVIAIAYAFRHFVKALTGGILGLILAVPVLWIFISLLNPMNDPLFTRGALTGTQYEIILAIPLFCALLTFVTTFVTVLHRFGKNK